MKKKYEIPFLVIEKIEVNTLCCASASITVTVDDVVSGDECPCGCDPDECDVCKGGCDMNDPCAFR